MPGLDSIDRFLAERRARYTARRPRSAQLAAGAARFLPGGNTRSVLHADPFPFRVVGAAGSELLDVDGHSYVDLLGNYSAGLFGADPPFVREAIEAALDSGWSFGAVNPAEAELARLICERFASIDRVRFTNSGTEANLMALSAARLSTGRDAIVVFDGAYHGGVLSFAPAGLRLNPPYDWIVCEYNSADSVGRAFGDRGSQIAAVLVEPMLGAGGCIPADGAFVSRLADLCGDHGSVLIFDEVMTSRLSAGGAQELLGVRPDMTTLGKYLGGGLTFGAFGGREEIMARFDVTSDGGVPHGGTFNNNLLSMSAGVAALATALTADVLARLNERGEKLRLRLNRLFAERGVGMCATGWGSIMTIHATAGPIDGYASLSTADQRVSAALFMFLADEGYYIAPRGYLALSLQVTDAQLDGFVAAVESFADQVASL